MQADTIDVTLNYKRDKLVFRVSDNGKGFNLQKQQGVVHKGLGLRNINNRVRMVKGDIFFESKESSGTVVTISIQP